MTDKEIFKKYCDYYCDYILTKQNKIRLKKSHGFHQYISNIRFSEAIETLKKELGPVMNILLKIIIRINKILEKLRSVK